MTIEYLDMDGRPIEESFYQDIHGDVCYNILEVDGKVIIKASSDEVYEGAEFPRELNGRLKRLGDIRAETEDMRNNANWLEKQAENQGLTQKEQGLIDRLLDFSKNLDKFKKK